MIALNFGWHLFTNWLLGLGGMVAIIAALAWIAFFATTFFGLPWNIRLIILQVAAGASLFSAAWSYAATTNYKAGRDDTLAIIRNMNAEAAGHVEQQLKKVDDCYNDGGIWDSTSGLCQR